VLGVQISRSSCFSLTPSEGLLFHLLLHMLPNPLSAPLPLSFNGDPPHLTEKVLHGDLLLCFCFANSLLERLSPPTKESPVFFFFRRSASGRCFESFEFSRYKFRSNFSLRFSRGPPCLVLPRRTCVVATPLVPLPFL